jgi:MoCo/4Fe-4S cofactor protein with predicted Tat translocation signal
MSPMNNKKVDHSGREYWRSLDQLADTPEFNEFLRREFPESTVDLPARLNRRQFLTLMGASLALAGLTSCRRPVEKIIPYVKAPEEIIPGIPQYYATTMPFRTGAFGLIVESHEGRPTKIEGNPDHPANRGGTNAFIQAAVLELYDPDRSQAPVQKGEEKSWQDFGLFWQNLYPDFIKKQGEGLAVLSEAFASPTLYRLKSDFHKKYPKANWYTYEPVSDENIFDGIEAISGSVAIPEYNFEQAKLILALDADFLGLENESILSARQFINGRKPESPAEEMNRLYVVEPAFTLTGAMADHRQKLARCRIPTYLLVLIELLLKRGVKVPGSEGLRPADGFEFDSHWLEALTDDLIRSAGRNIVLAGRQQNPLVHALVNLINFSLGNIGSTVQYRQPADWNPAEQTQLNNLIENLRQNKIDTLIMLGGNPVYNAPADLEFKSLLGKADHTIHLSYYYDETSRLAEWHLPQSHFLECWSDARAAQGTAGIVQPLIEPLFKSNSAIEMAAFVTRGKWTTAYDLVRETWRALLKVADFEQEWRRVLHQGYLENSEYPVVRPKLNLSGLKQLVAEYPVVQCQPDATHLEILFQPSYSVYDGRYANNGWLQELPDCITKLAWDNAAVMSGNTACQLGLKNEDLIVINNKERDQSFPVWIVPGTADFTIALELGYGRTAAGRIGNQAGFNAYTLRTSKSLYFDTNFHIRKTIDMYKLANTQEHGYMEGRPIIREASLEEYRRDPKFAREMVEYPPLISLWQEHSYDKGYQWGMVIDLNRCIGCNTCTIACQSENNIPIVGKQQVRNGREMHWLRLDRYFTGDTDDPQMVFQPMACQHCENAPCEQVCPVAATVHDGEGLNLMVYNRCVGTRYCSNNCPFKVRRFNFFNYTKDYPEIIKMVQNPDVTVRSRGVMEKCTYCLQRLHESKHKAKMQNRVLKDGEVQTACQQACPTQAIYFGNINDPESRIRTIKQADRNYEMLAELNIKPRTSYLAKIRNPNPEIPEKAQGHKGIELR